MTPAGIEPATFRFVAQHFNHSATEPCALILSTKEVHIVGSILGENCDCFPMNYAENKAHKKIASFMNFYIMQELRLWKLRTWRTGQGMVMNSPSDNRGKNVPNKTRNIF